MEECVSLSRTYFELPGNPVDIKLLFSVQNKDVYKRSPLRLCILSSMIIFIRNIRAKISKHIIVRSEFPILSYLMN